MTSKQELKIRSIRPDSRMSEGSVTAIRHLMREIWVFRSHIWIVFGEQFRSAYYGSRLGVIWNYVLPLVPISVYLFISRLRAFTNFEGVDSTILVTFGVTLWFFFSGCVQIPIQTVRSRNKEVMKTAFPLSASIVSGFAQMLFETLVRLVFLCVIVFLTKSWPAVQGLLLPLALAPAILLFIGMGLFLGVLNVIYNDVSRLVAILLQYGLFVSGVIFPLHGDGLLSKLNMYNPFSVFIDAARSLVFHGAILNLTPYLAMTLVGTLVFVLSCRLFYVMEYRVRGIT